MTDNRIVHSIVKKCDIYYGNALLSGEKIIEKYLEFFSKQFNPEERTVSFAFHTGSLCFDVVSIAALMIGCLAYDSSSNDEILTDLEIGDMVLYNNKRYHWCGIEKRRLNVDDPEIDYIVLRQDAKGKNGPSILSVPYDRNKHMVKPYYGTSSITDGRGIKKDKSNRNDFISYVLDVPIYDIPIKLDISVVVVADKNKFIEICNHLKIRYKEDKYVRVMDIVPVSYYTSPEEAVQIGGNPSKAEAVIKVTNRISTARDLILDRHGNKIIGLLVTNVESLRKNSAELNDLMRRKSLRFAYFIAPFSIDSSELAMEQYESAKIFACTKEILSSLRCELGTSNKLTRELNRQILNIIHCEIYPIKISGFCDWIRYRELKEKLYAVKQSNWSGEECDNFILSAIAMINLFSTSFFNMEVMETAIQEGTINAAVLSPKKRLAELQNIASRNLSMKEKCSDIILCLLDMYTAIQESSPKEKALMQFLNEHWNQRIVIIVPKAYYSEIFAAFYQQNYPNVSCVTANRFDKQGDYDLIVVPGDITGKRFDALQCYSSSEIYLFLYEFEEKTFSYRRHKVVKSERKLNAKIKGLRGTEYAKAIEIQEEENAVPKQVLHEFSDLDAFVETMGAFDIRRFVSHSTDVCNTTTEVKYIGTFTTGEQILFSKYYSAVVFDQYGKTVTEISPEKLNPGDILVFTKRNDYTSNIVDQIFDQLRCTQKMSKSVRDAAEKALYWKDILREYKEENRLTYRAIAKALKKLGSPLQEVTIRQWLVEGSHIVGPRDLETMKMIAELTQDAHLLKNPNEYFEACLTVRHYRREILKLIAQVISDKLSNIDSSPEPAFEIVYENVDKLSETMELENVFELNEVAVINNSMVNRPIIETEVLM